MTERTLIEGGGQAYEAERREQKLVRDFAHYLERNGIETCRLQLWPEDEAAPLFCDLYDRSANTIYEAKGSVSRPAIRMAIGQLADYARFVDPPAECALLLPEPPRPNLVELALSQGISIVHPRGPEFVSLGTELPVDPSVCPTPN